MAWFDWLTYKYFDENIINVKNIKSVYYKILEAQ